MKEKIRRKLNTMRISRYGMAIALSVSLLLASVIPFPGRLLADEKLDEVQIEESTEAEESVNLDEEGSLNAEKDADEEETSDGKPEEKEEIKDEDDISVEQDESENTDRDIENDVVEEDEENEAGELISENDTIRAEIEQNDNEDNEDEFPYVLTIENKTEDDADGIRVAADTDRLSFSYAYEDENEDMGRAGDADNEDSEDNLKNVRQVFSRDDEDGELVFAKPLAAGDTIVVLLYAEYAQEDSEELYGGYEDAIVTVKCEDEEKPLRILVPADYIAEIAEQQEGELAENELTEDGNEMPDAGEDSEEAEEPDDLEEDEAGEEPEVAAEEESSEDNGVFSIKLPTTFEIPMFSTDEGIEVMSEDVVLCNEGDFPVDVTVSRVEVSVKRRLPESTVRQAVMPTDEDVTHDLVEEAKQCDLSLRLLLDGQDAQECPAPEGVTENVSAFTLAERKPDTDANQLMEDRFADRVDSPDYAILNFRGTATDGTGITWEKGDLKAKIVFSFAKHEEP